MEKLGGKLAIQGPLFEGLCNPKGKKKKRKEKKSLFEGLLSIREFMLLLSNLASYENKGIV